MEPIHLTTREAMSRLRVQKSKLYGLIDSGEIARLKVGSKTLIPVRSIEDYEARNTQVASLAAIGVARVAPVPLPVDALGWPIRLRDRLHKDRTKDATAIGWTWYVLPNGDYIRGFSFNCWIGCTKVSAECALCYADLVATDKMGRNLWGKDARRMFMSAGNWKRLEKMDRLACELGHTIKIFVNSMSDLFEILREDHPDFAEMEIARRRMFEAMEAYPRLTFICCTKRPFNVMRLVPADWHEAFPPNVWVLTTTGTQDNADRLIPELLKIPAAVLGLSVEPMLAPIVLPAEFLALGHRGWVIAGGESGKKNQPVRPTNPKWFRSLRDQCDAAGVPFFLKQIGDWTHDTLLVPGSRLAGLVAVFDPSDKALVRAWPDGSRSYRHVKRANGRELDGREWNQFPR